MKMCGINKCISWVIVVTMLVSGIYFASDKAESLSSCAFLSDSLCNSEAEIYNAEQVGNLQLLKCAGLASAIRENKQCIPKTVNRINVQLFCMMSSDIYLENEFAYEYCVMTDEWSCSSVIVKFIQRQDGKKAELL